MESIEKTNGSTTVVRTQSAPVKESPPSPIPTPTPTPTPIPTTPPANANQSANFEELFRVFAKFGDPKGVGDAITLSNSDKWFKQSKVIDGKKLTTVDTGIYFKQIAKTKRSLNLSEYCQFLETIAKNKKLDLNEIKHKLATSGTPSTTKTTTAVTTGAVGRLTDHTKYTGSHKQRFDNSGKGKGREGREDVSNKSGYVSGFKAEEHH
ncbi:tubulin polymerization-promoting protein homolog isoform X2 [Oppia nitens]|nr:tubulin polymerization-promoting protein homolog isoform X2 [Oppia nitens]XP_054165396.1 tubulin polymerization-promoting protein homolog isoform X2 [Oppia nitens]XP_054165397.1 tubulin polymerization-promoting protein homolog isoform X2 [Oppia nitens]